MKRGYIWILTFFLPLVLCAQQSVDISPVILSALESGQDVGMQDQKVKKDQPPDYVQFDQPPEVINQIQPDYPNEALSKHLEGMVWLKLWIDEAGKVVEAKVMKTDSEVFNRAAVDAGKKWTFKPASVNGKPVAVWVSVPFRFKLETANEPESPAGKAKAREMQRKKAAYIEKVPADNVPYDKPPEAIKQVMAQYPDYAKKAHIEGTVWVKVWIDEQGKTKKAEVLKSENELFNASAKAAVTQWEFKPATKDGKPVAVWVMIPFKFKLTEETEPHTKK